MLKLTAMGLGDEFDIFNISNYLNDEGEYHHV